MLIRCSHRNELKLFLFHHWYYCESLVHVFTVICASDGLALFVWHQDDIQHVINANAPISPEIFHIETRWLDQSENLLLAWPEMWLWTWKTDQLNSLGVAGQTVWCWCSWFHVGVAGQTVWCWHVGNCVMHWQYIVTECFYVEVFQINVILNVFTVICAFDILELFVGRQDGIQHVLNADVTVSPKVFCVDTWPERERGKWTS